MTDVIPSGRNSHSEFSTWLYNHYAQEIIRPESRDFYKFCHSANEFGVSQVVTAYINYSKCFDSIGHNVLIQKLNSIRVHGDLLK